MAAINKLMNKSFLTRFISGFVLTILMLVTFIVGGDVAFGVFALVSMIGLFEFLRVFEMHKSIPGIAAYIAGVGYLVALRLSMMQHFIPMALGFLIVLLAIYVFSFPKYTIQDILPCYFGVFYIVVLLSYLYQIRMMEDGIFAIWLVFICSWISDTFAYLVGVMFGKHKMAPILSPKKSIEGGIGGVAGAAIIGFVFALIFKNQFSHINHPTILFPIVCGIGSLVGQVGDLCASGVKRNKEIKDYGTLIPGHGGVMDRFDSVITTAPMIFYLLMYMN